MKALKNFLKDESGQGLVEYGLVIGLVAVGVVGTVAILGTIVKTVLYDNVVEKLNGIVSNL